MKKVLIAALIVVAALALCAPAFAWPVALPWWQPSPHFTCVGKLKAVDTTANTVTVRVHLASRGVADYLAEDLTINVGPKAKIFKAEGDTFKAIAISDLVVGEKLRVEGRIDCSAGAPVYIGKRLVMRHLPINDIKRFAFRGPVTVVDAVAGTLSARLNAVTRVLSPFYHAEFAFSVAPGARVWVMKNGWPVKAALTDVVVGDRVYAQGGVDRSDPAAPVFTIRWMLVRHLVPAPTPIAP
jgi:hypothetical protein